MKFFPKSNYILLTTLSPYEITNKLSEVIEPKKISRNNFFKSGKNRPYEGFISGNTFEINPLIMGRGLIVPVIEGEIEKKENFTLIKINMELEPAAFTFMVLWLSFFILALTGSVFSQILNQEFEPMSLLILPIGIFGYIIPIFSFDGSISDAKKFLKRLFEATEI